MFLTAAIAVLIAALIGLVFKYAVPKFVSRFFYLDWRISWREYGAGLALLSLIIAPAVVTVGNQLSVAETLVYEEFYNGVETKATETKTVCQAGTSGGSASSGHSNCAYEYNTGETYTYLDFCPQVRTYTDGQGNLQTTIDYVPCPKSAYIYHPYATTEFWYEIEDSLGGEHVFPLAYLDENPQPFGNVAIPSSLPRGAPPEWTDARARLDAGDPRAVTRIFEYDNYILAAKDDMLLPFSQDVERYKAEGILPDHTANIKDDPLTGYSKSFANKVSFVGVDVADEDAWQKALMEFNAALGSQYRGDMHIVLIDSALVDDSVTYLNALKAYWLSEEFERRAIAKNAIIVAIGVHNDQVDWARATTGMPFGNEVMLESIKALLPGTPLEPNAVIGDPKTIVTPASNSEEDDTVQVVLSQKMGALEDAVLHTFPFQRACMGCQDDEGQIGYDNLISKVQPPFWQLSVMVGIVGLLSIGWWILVSRFTLFERRPKPDPQSTYDLYRREISRPLLLRRNRHDY